MVLKIQQWIVLFCLYLVSSQKNLGSWIQIAKTDQQLGFFEPLGFCGWLGNFARAPSLMGKKNLGDWI